MILKKFPATTSARTSKPAELVIAESLVAAAHQPACITDPDNYFVYVNPAFERFYGRSAASILGCTPKMLVSPQCPEATLHEVVETTRHAGAWCGQLENVDQQGREVRVELRTRAIRDRRSRVVGMVAFAKPLSSVPSVLSAQQQQIYRRLGQGSTVKEIAAAMDLSVSTVATQIQRSLEKLPLLRDAHDLQCHAIRTMAQQVAQWDSGPDVF